MHASSSKRQIMPLCAAVCIRCAQLFVDFYAISFQMFSISLIIIVIIMIMKSLCAVAKCVYIIILIVLPTFYLCSIFNIVAMYELYIYMHFTDMLHIYTNTYVYVNATVYIKIIQYYYDWLWVLFDCVPPWSGRDAFQVQQDADRKLDIFNMNEVNIR